MGLTYEQQRIMDNNKKMLVVSASAGSGKTFVLVKYIANLIISKKIPLKRFLVLTFTKAAAREMKERLLKAFLEEKTNSFINEQIDDMPSSDISTIDAFCEKVLKQNIAKTDLDENFSILDEKQSYNLKRKAFDETVEKFSENESESFGEIYFAFKKNNDMIFECIESISSFFDSQEDEEYLLDYYQNNSEKIFNQACKFLNEKLKNDIVEISSCLFEFNSQDSTLLNEYEQLNQILSLNIGEDFIENVLLISKIERPRLSQKKIDKKNQAILKSVSAKIKDLIDKCKQFDFSPYSIQKQKLAILPNAILKFYKQYKVNYEKIKSKYDVIDFADCEKKVKQLLQDKEILKTLQESYDYIFVDEYQDTNKLQESIIKPIAEQGMFMAVGDIKQGIYGFRNASMEIMLSDIEEFSKSNDGDALFLKSNFRSDKNILNFVNYIFEKTMTKESCGIDYKKTSMLVSEQEFIETSKPNVEIYVCKEQVEEDCDLPKVYSVKDDVLKTKSKNPLEARVVVEKVKEFLQSNIYNPKSKQFEKVKPQDIAILFRSRKETMTECYNLLKQNNIPTITDAKSLLFDSPLVQILNNLLKLLLSFDDDIALSSVLLSPFGDFDFNLLTNILKTGQGSLYQKCLEQKSTNPKIEEFFEKIKYFEMLVQVKGVVNALKIFINENNFLAKMPKEVANEQEMQNIEDFYNLIYSLNAEFNIPKIVNTFENAELKTNSVTQSENSVLLTTIHATKGLEYPIVILACCGEDFDKTLPKSYELSKKYGLGTNVYDNISLTKSPSIVLKAIKEEKKQKEWIDELMIFYVALTRAKNHLVLCGTGKDFIIKSKVHDCKNYLDLLYFSMGQNLLSSLEEQGQIKNKLFDIKIVEGFEENIESVNLVVNKNENLDYENLYKELNFDYKNKDVCCFELKNSVTSINEKEKGENKAVVAISNERQNFIDTGNSYHNAMKKLNFEKIFDYTSLMQEIEKDSILKEEIKDFVDYNLLLSNILKVKELCKNKVVYKEKDFVMSLKLNETGLLNSDEKIIIQGAIDCFAVGENDVTLIDYKYTTTQDENVLKNRYKKQLQLYAKALKKAFENKEIKIYLLSLRQAKIIDF